MEKKKHRHKRCGEIARGRARHARAMKSHPLLVALVFVTALLSLPSPVRFPSIPRSRSGKEGSWPVSDYERGCSTAPKRTRDRHKIEPSIRHLLRDLRRPAARFHAEQLLLDRVPDIALRYWVEEQIREGCISRLAAYVRPGDSDERVLVSWRSTLDGENADLEAAADDAVDRQNALKLLSGLVDKDFNPKSGRRP